MATFLATRAPLGVEKMFFSWPGAAFRSSMAPLDVFTMAPLGVGRDFIARADGWTSSRASAEAHGFFAPPWHLWTCSAPLDVLTMAPLGVGGDFIARADGWSSSRASAEAHGPVNF